jgi:hypothetical protein
MERESVVLKIKQALLIGLGMVIALSLSQSELADAQQKMRQFTIVDTGLDRCYGSRWEIRCPKRGRPFFGQDAQYEGNQAAYRDNGDGTITDLNTGLMWQKTPDFRTRSWMDAGKYAQTLRLAGYHDWRLPTIKELFSLADFRGNIRTRTPYIDARYFDFRYPPRASGKRIIDGQYWSANRYVGTTMFGDRSAFGFNFADGRIKSYPLFGPRGRVTFRDRRYVRCVRGPSYGMNDFVDNGDGTVTDRATGLMWMQSDSRRTMNWEQALQYAEDLQFAGYDDWRLPNVKELQSIVDYRRAPDARAASACGAAIDPIFNLTDEESWFWTSTTHIENGFGYYVCFGQALSALKRLGKPVNAHGAGAVRSDPKAGDPSQWPHGLGPQSDEIRIYNYVRCVRLGKARLRISPSGPTGSSRQRKAPRFGSHEGPFVRRLDTDGDGKVSLKEFDGPPDHFRMLDRNGDGFVTEQEARLGAPPGHGPPRGHGQRPGRRLPPWQR